MFGALVQQADLMVPPSAESEKMTKARGFLNEVRGEIERATAIHGPMNSLHEGWAVLFEEVDELWDEVKLKASKRDALHIRTELMQIAAMATRMAVDLGYA